MGQITITVAGEERSVGEFSAFKVLTALEIVATAEEAYREALKAMAGFKREYEGDNYVELERAEARRVYGPRPLWREIPVLEDGEIVRDGDGMVLLRREPLLDGDGVPVLGPDQLGHLTEADWEQSGHKIRQASSPREELEWAAALPVGFRLARDHVLRLVALVLTTNQELERWDDSGESIEAKLDAEGKRLLHRAAPEELLGVLTAALEVGRDQLVGPFSEAIAKLGEILPNQSSEETPAPPAMQVEGEESKTPSSSSSTDSPGDTTGAGEISGTGSPSESSAISAPA